MKNVKNSIISKNKRKLPNDEAFQERNNSPSKRSSSIQLPIVRYLTNHYKKYDSELCIEKIRVEKDERIKRIKIRIEKVKKCCIIIKILNHQGSIKTRF